MMAVGLLQTPMACASCSSRRMAFSSSPTGPSCRMQPTWRQGSSPRSSWQSSSRKSPGTAAMQSKTSPSAPDMQFDPSGYTKYALAIPTQVGLMSGALWVLQQACDALSSGTLSLPADLQGPDAAKALVTLFFLVVSIKSRVFSPLDASRPNVRGEKAAISQRKRPSWMPPPLTFPIVWTTIGLLRAASSVMVWEACGRDLLAAPLVVMMTHLSIGDAWNHCNNVDQKLGMAVPGVILGCWGSGLWVCSAYYMADPNAGLLLSPMCVWLSIASVLVYTIWDINPDPVTGERQPLVPVKEV